MSGRKEWRIGGRAGFGGNGYLSNTLGAVKRSDGSGNAKRCIISGTLEGDDLSGGVNQHSSLGNMEV